MWQDQTRLKAKNAMSSRLLSRMVGLIAVMLGVWNAMVTQAAEVGITPTAIHVGGVMALDGDFRSYGLGVKAGIEAALKGEKVQGRVVEFTALNDFYNPAKTEVAVRQLVQEGVFLMMGNVGTLTTRKALPILAEHKIPAFGFYTGGGLTGPGDVLNVRAGYAQEIASVIEAAIAAGVKPNEVCAFLQNDPSSVGLQTFRAALVKYPGTEKTVALLDKLLAMQGDNPPRNDVGPVGVYQRETLAVREGYQSLKKWEASAGVRCRLVVTSGVHDAISQFIGYAYRNKGEKWLFSATSFVAAGDSLRQDLKLLDVTDRVIITQIVPALDAPLPVVQEARSALDKSLNYITLEGYIVGKLFLAIARASGNELTRANFVKAARSQAYDIGGFKVDFTKDGSQGSSFVLLTSLNGDKYETLSPRDLSKLLPQ